MQDAVNESDKAYTGEVSVETSLSELKNRFQEYSEEVNYTVNDTQDSNHDIVIEQEIVKVTDNNCPQEHRETVLGEPNIKAVHNEEEKKEDFEQEEKEKTVVIEDFQAVNNEKAESEKYEKLCYEWTAPKLICKASNEFKPSDICESFAKGCHWSPDGTCILVPTEDFKVKIFDVPRDLYGGVLPEDFQMLNLESSLKIKEGGTVYDTCWFPYMSSWDSSTCCFLSTSQGSPVHLWDALTGQLRATYRAYNLVDEVEAAISVYFANFGGQIWSGFKNALRVFDTNQPGRQISNIFLKKDFPNVSGLVSCIRENPEMPGLMAFGTYSKCIGLYKDGPICTFQAGSGVTQVEFSQCGTKLYSTVRRNGELLCWDLRNPGAVLHCLGDRQSDTNQRIWFDLAFNGEEIVSGGTDGLVRLWKITSDQPIDEDICPTYKIKISKDCVNGVSLHKNLPLLATSTGERKFDDEGSIIRDNSLCFYWLNR
ncbi:telomerase Cajal body protein 1 isoform X2 [Copidosoma floridanum]|uniref:telomerase Cajal body protein 1 isoform X2 n=1 Tax=Copidosoma floridanum TaxID=29053 RepID=UPI0006C9AEF9|nr:telomerase Cajal body protein 1 isoform X2 [Copidosoma floridanum]